MTGALEQENRPSREELGRALLDTGSMTSDWAPTYEAVPRSAFLPDLMWPHDLETGRNSAVDRALLPAAWQEYADSNQPIVTRWDDAAHHGPEPGRPCSSSSAMPSVVFSRLADLDVKPGQRVLEIGTGTGWNAALLAHRLGPENVITVEPDGTVAAEARRALERFGLPVEVVHGDGSLGHTNRAPYDRIIATRGPRKVPFAWVKQTTPGGVILVPRGTYYGPGEATARLVVAENRRSASGPFSRPATFTRMRSPHGLRPSHGEYVPPETPPEATESTAPKPGDDFSANGAFDAAGFAMGLRVPNITHHTGRERDGKRAVWFYGLSDPSWAIVVFRDGRADHEDRDDREEAEAYQSGPRRLWDEMKAAHEWWVERERPGCERFGLTVDADGERAWLDSPDNPVSSE